MRVDRHKLIVAIGKARTMSQLDHALGKYLDFQLDHWSRVDEWLSQQERVTDEAIAKREYEQDSL